MKDMPCLCDGRTDIICTGTSCSIAGPGELGNPDSCRVCWVRLGKPAIQGPSLLRRLYNFGRAMFQFARSGAELVSTKEAQHRLTQCLPCEWYDQERDRCTSQECGCRISQKVWLKSERCPLKPPKW